MMVIEAYLFHVTLKKKFSRSQLTGLLNNLGLIKLPAKTDNIDNFELVNKNSIIEFELIHGDNNLINFFVRFCIANKIEVVDDLFNFLKKLSNISEIIVHEYHSKKQIFLDSACFERIKNHTDNMKKLIEKYYGKIELPIRCADIWKKMKK